MPPTKEESNAGACSLVISAHLRILKPSASIISTSSYWSDVGEPSPVPRLPPLSAAGMWRHNARSGIVTTIVYSYLLPLFHETLLDSYSKEQNPVEVREASKAVYLVAMVYYAEKSYDLPHIDLLTLRFGTGVSCFCQIRERC
jgi:hypothetical protein